MQQSNCSKRRRIQKQYAARKAQRLAKSLKNIDTSSSEGSANEFQEIEPSIVSETSDHSPIKEAEEPINFDFNGFWDSINKSSSEIESDESSFDIPNAEELLRNWALKHNATNSSITDLLTVLRILGLNLPKDSRTLMKTPRNASSKISKISGGEYTFFGVANGIKKTLEFASKPDVEKLELSFNIDGLPIFSSKKLSVWPIQATIDNIETVSSKPFIVALFCGVQKPQDNEFLKDTINELDQLLDTGVDGKCVEVKSIICDAPARAMVKGTVQFNGRYGCDYCDIRGVFDGSMLFLRKGNERTNESFRERQNPEHHKQDSPFLKLESLDMIFDFPLDPMHCVDLGVTKRLMITWKLGPLPIRLSANHISLIGSSLVALKRFIPNVFNRKPRSLEELKLWKASEFRTFLLYTGPIVLKAVLNPEQYLHFMSLSVAMRILYSKELITLYSDFLTNCCTTLLKRQRNCTERNLYPTTFTHYCILAILQRRTAGLPCAQRTDLKTICRQLNAV